MGRIEEFTLDISPLSQNPRTIWVYLPDSYDTSKQKYSVLYMFDGHNLFDDSVATYGKSWGIKEYLDAQGLDLVVIGQDCNHTGNHRLEEYCPFPIEGKSWIGNLNTRGDITADWFVNTLKPYCEKKYRIYKDRRHVGIAGSSMGGLMSFYCIAKYNGIYSKAGCVSPTMDIQMPQLIHLINTTDISPKTRIYMDFGSREVKAKNTLAKCIDNLLTLNHAFQMHNCNTFPNIVVGGTHSEATWEKIVPLMLEYMYPELYETTNE